jgi:hypothetical protein
VVFLHYWDGLGESLATAPRRIFLRARHALGNSSARGEKMKVG